MGDDGRVLSYLIGAVIAIIPVWHIFGRTGQRRFYALLIIIPLIGPMIVALIFGLGRWKFDK